jgi:integrase/recombinase XerD
MPRIPGLRRLHLNPEAHWVGSYDAVQHRWTGHCTAAGVGVDIHQLRHAHATELINAGVSIEAVRRLLGHTPTKTTQLYALLDDKVAAAEIRAARRRARDRNAADVTVVDHS